MRLYRITVEAAGDLFDNRTDLWQGALAAAHEVAKTLPTTYRSSIYIDQMDVPNDKETLLLILNNNLPLPRPEATWGLTDRGGLRGGAGT